MLLSPNKMAAGCCQASHLAKKIEFSTPKSENGKCPEVDTAPLHLQYLGTDR